MHLSLKKSQSQIKSSLLPPLPSLPPSCSFSFPLPSSCLCSGIQGAVGSDEDMKMDPVHLPSSSVHVGIFASLFFQGVQVDKV